ncbi:uncharacterized protein LOC131306757 [Rhododendron vialii]|uniref:uncharacterized protein LOC131306757 n=1 Tax=Rhododendron vialii TaxID=182163 RepID=UPI00265F66A4|nr:uncharacterized protein LOC131306757 [Rhododendron vialii]
MAIVIRYMDKKGNVIEHFLGIQYVANTNALSLKDAMENLFCRLRLSTSRLREQGYDGASNMQGEFNDLKALTLKENPCAYYVHCFAHQLQLALVGLAKKQEQIGMLFYFVNRVVIVVGVSCKCCGVLWEKQLETVVQALCIGELSSGQGLNQETNLQCPGDTRWGSHYRTLVRLMGMFDSVIHVLEIISEEGSNTDQKAEWNVLMDNLQSFEFVLNLHLMRAVLAITSKLSLALRKKDQEIVNALTLVQMSKIRLQMMRDIYTVIDLQLQELNDHLTKANSELLLCVACLDPRNYFSSFDKKKLLRLAEFCPKEFSPVDLMVLYDQLDMYIFDMYSSDEFLRLNGLTDLSEKMVETGREKLYPLVYLLLTLALLLPVATASVE